jgi:predicted PurR-regulated permease PerM
VAHSRPRDDDQIPRHAALPRRTATRDARDLGWRVVETTSIALALLLLASLLWFAADVLLLLFAAVLLATLLRAATNGLVQLTGLPDRLALALVLLLAVAGLVALGLLLAPQVASQVPELVDNLGQAIERLQQRLGLATLTKELAKEVKLSDLLPSTAGVLGGATGIISSSFGALANVVIMLVIGVYLAADPDLYLRGIAHLVPARRRQATRELLETLGQTLRWWMVGQLIIMAAVGVLTYLGLRLLDVPLALILALVAFFFVFIPFIGAILAGIPVALVAFSQGLGTGLYALAIYSAIEMFEGYILSPLVQRRSVALPPALTIAAQVLLGVLLGVLGVALATPIAAAAMVAIQRLYVEELLGDDGDIRANRS